MTSTFGKCAAAGLGFASWPTTTALGQNRRLRQTRPDVRSTADSGSLSRVRLRAKKQTSPTKYLPQIATVYLVIYSTGRHLRAVSCIFGLVFPNSPAALTFVQAHRSSLPGVQDAMGEVDKGVTGGQGGAGSCVGLHSGEVTGALLSITERPRAHSWSRPASGCISNRRRDRT